MRRPSAFVAGQQAFPVNDGAPEPRFGIVPKILLALVFVFAASLIGFVLIASGLEQASDRLSLLTRHHLPALTRAAELLSQSHRLVSRAADLLSVRTDMVRDDMVAQLEGFVEEKTRLMKELHSLDPNFPDLDKMDRSFEALAANLKELAVLAARRIELQQRITEQVEHLRRLSVEIERLGNRPGVPSCRTAWQHQAQRALVELLAVAEAQDSGQVEHRKRDYLRMLAAMGGSLDCLDKQATLDLLRLHRHIAKQDSARDIFTLRLSELDLVLGLETRLIRDRNIAESLLLSVDDLFLRVQRDTYTRNREIEQGLATRLGMIVVISLLLLGICVGVWIYLRHALLEPILGLRRAMRNQLRGDSADYPHPARDELGAVITEVRKAIDSLKLREQELILAKAEVERISNSKSLFLAHVSHELRTPLHAILGYADLLRRDVSLEKSQVKSCIIIKQSGKHLLELIDDLLDLAAMEAGYLHLSYSELDFDTFLEELCGIIEPQAQAKGLSFRINKDGPLPARVYTDGKRLRQVLINLLINAIKYSDRGSVLLRVEPFGGNDVRVELRFSVIDNGPGIRLEKQQEIFEAFRRIEVAQEGVGLGLCICRQLVGLMGGQLNLDSQPGLGSRFWFKLEFERCEWPVSAQSERNSDASPHPEFEVPPLLELETALELAQDEDWERLSEWSTDLVDGQPGFDTFAVRLEELTASGDPEVVVEWLRGFVPER